MRYQTLAVDYDGTIARHGVVDDVTFAALERLKKSGRKLILATGRQMDELKQVMPRWNIFDRVVAENGALLVRPSTKEELPLAPPPPSSFVRALRGAGVDPIAVGKVIVATWTPHETTVLRTIRDLGLDLQIIFNKGAVMILPPNVNKASGVKAALDDLGLSAHNLVGAGDAENDHAFLQMCEISVAVQNALPAVKARADIVAAGDHGDGVREVIDRLLVNDLVDLDLPRHRIALGKSQSGVVVDVPPFHSPVLVAGSSGGGKSTFATAFLEKLADRAYQFCIIDPEGDYGALPIATALGDVKREPVVTEVLDVLQTPSHNVCVNMLAVPLDERPTFFASVMTRLAELRAQTGRPHFVVVDEAHHVLPRSTRPDAKLFVDRGVVLITVHPDQVAAPALKEVADVIAVGKDPAGSLKKAAEALGIAPPSSSLAALEPGEAYVWRKRGGPSGDGLVHVVLDPPRSERLRHRRKYAEGDLGPKAFYFKGADEKLNLRAENLVVFMRLARGVDDDTWLFHLKRGDYSRWCKEAIKDPELSAAVEKVEHDKLDPVESRARVAHAIEERYTLP